MHKGLYLTNDCIPKGRAKEMCVEALDVATSYLGGQQSLKLAVLIQNASGEPVHKSTVDIVLGSPNGSKFSLSGKTDSQGVAFFNMENVESGRWEVIIFQATHPEYDIDLSSCKKRWSIAQV